MMRKNIAVTLNRGFAELGNYVWSPFVVKLEARLRFDGVAYTTANGSLSQAPKGKVPYVECRGPGLPPLDGALGPSCVRKDDAAGPAVWIADSTMIAKTFVDWGLVSDLNAALPPDLKAYDLALRALLEDKLNFYNGQEKWIDNYATMRDHVFSAMSLPLRTIVGLIAWRATRAKLAGQGTGRFSDAELRLLRSEVWDAVDGLLGAAKVKAEAKAKAAGADKGPFWALGGAAPTEADAALFGFIASALVCNAAPDSQKILRGLDSVMEYAGRIHNKYFTDYEKWEE